MSKGETPPVTERLEMPVATQKTDSGLTPGLLRVLNKQVSLVLPVMNTSVGETIISDVVFLPCHLVIERSFCSSKVGTFLKGLGVKLSKQRVTKLISLVKLKEKLTKL